MDSEKYTVSPFPSVNLPSSNICKNMSSTRGCAFSISSNRMTEKVFAFIALVRVPLFETHVEGKRHRGGYLLFEFIRISNPMHTLIQINIRKFFAVKSCQRPWSKKDAPGA